MRVKVHGNHVRFVKVVHFSFNFFLEFWIRDILLQSQIEYVVFSVATWVIDDHRRCIRFAVAFPPFAGELEQVRLQSGNDASVQLEERFLLAALLHLPFREMRCPAVLGGGIGLSGL